VRRAGWGRERVEERDSLEDRETGQNPLSLAQGSNLICGRGAGRSWVRTHRGIGETHGGPSAAPIGQPDGPWSPFAGRRWCGHACNFPSFAAFSVWKEVFWTTISQPWHVCHVQCVKARMFLLYCVDLWLISTGNTEYRVCHSKVQLELQDFCCATHDYEARTAGSL
jgi:hypothetical protein